MHTFYVHPSPARGELDYGVIKYIIQQHQRLLPKHGWQEVDIEDEAELVVGHLGTRSKRVDVFHLHGLYPTGMIRMPKNCWAANAVIVENLRRSRNVVCVSEWVAELLRREMHLSPLVLGHGIDLKEWASVQPYTKAERPYALWNKTRNFGVCDPMPVVELARRLSDMDFMTTFMPPVTDYPPNIAVTGTMSASQMWPIVKSAAVYLATTKETFSISVLEAMASGVPVVGFRWGNVPTLVDGCGLLVEPYDYDGLADAVQEALDRREELGAAGLELVAQYEWARVVEKLAGLYEHCRKKSSDAPRVTVVIPCYNYARYVGQAIQSVLEQTYTDWELIVVDDGSEDNSVSVIREAISGVPNAKLVIQENMGVAHARNFGISKGTGEYVVCLDADDMMASTFLERLVPPMDDDRSIGLAYTGIRVVVDGKVADNVHTWPVPYDPVRGMEGNQIPTCCMYRREMWEGLGGYRQRFAPHGAGLEDGDFWCRILAAGGGARMVTRDGLFHYRLHPKSATRQHPSDWKHMAYYDWYPWRADGDHPVASQLGVPERGSWPVRDYDRPRVSVVVPVGPYHSTIFEDALDSVEAQTYRFWELIVVDDTGKQLDLSAWPYARIVRTRGSVGVAKARNIGAEQVRTPLVVFLDADDILQPAFIEKTLRFWLDNGGGWIYTDMHYIDGDGNKRIYHTHEWDSGRLWVKGLAAVTALYPIDAWRAVNGFNEELQHEDWVFQIEITLAGWCGSRLPEPLITYRHTTGQRRLEGLEEKGFIEIKSRYSQEDLMGCNCGRGGGVKAGVQREEKPTPAKKALESFTGLKDGSIPEQPDSQFVLMMYVGKSSTDLTFRGRTGRMYVFNADHHQFCWVHQMDVGRLNRKSVLQIVDIDKLKATVSPELTVPFHVKTEASHESVSPQPA